MARRTRSSGAVEERWKPSDLTVNRLNAIVGYGIGGLLSLGLMLAAAQLFEPTGIEPDHLGTVPLLGLIVGSRGPLVRLGWRRARDPAPLSPQDVLPWDAEVAIEPERLVVGSGASEG